jgi:hypothetical protein
MPDNTSLVPVDFNQLPSTQVGTDDQFAELTKSTEYIGRLQLYTKGKAINKGLVRPGHYGIPETDEEVIDLGDSIDLVPLTRRPKAIDMTDTDAVIVNYDLESDEFKRIAAQSLEKESHCMCGPSFLVLERSTGRFLEFFCGSKSTRSEAKKVYPFLPLMAADIARQMAAGNDVASLEPHGPLPLTLRSRLVEKGTYSRHVPRRREVRLAVPEDAPDGSHRKGNHVLRELQGRRRRNRQGGRWQEAACSLGGLSLSITLATSLHDAPELRWAVRSGDHPRRATEVKRGSRADRGPTPRRQGA